MFSTRDTFFDESPAQPSIFADEPGARQQGASPDSVDALVMPEPIMPARDYESQLGPGGLAPQQQRQEDSDDEQLVPGVAASKPTQPAGSGVSNRAAMMQRMQMQARAARVQRPTMMMKPTSTEDDGFAARPSSRGFNSRAGVGSRGPFAPVNLQGAQHASTIGRRAAPIAVVSKTEQDLAKMGLQTEYDPTVPTRAAAASRSANGMAPARAVVDVSDVRGLLTKVPPPNTTVQCYVVRKKKGMFKAFPEYKLYLQQGGSSGAGSDLFLLSARKRKKQKKSNYLVSLDEEDMTKNSVRPAVTIPAMATNRVTNSAVELVQGNYYGKVKSNFIGTEFILFDKGAKPEDAQDMRPPPKPRKELGVVLYDTNVLGTKGPRKMTVVVPPVAPDGNVRADTSTLDGPSLLDQVKAGNFGESIRLHNKEPRWNESLGAYCLNFNGRVTLPSVKNFQLQIEGAADVNQVSMQFGKTGEDTFSMDYSYPLCPLQAFEIVLSSFDHKWACE